MAVWNKNNRSCTTTWFTLMVLDQIETDFKDSGGIKMSRLGFWNQTSSDEARRIQARGLAKQIDNMFKHVYHAKYEKEGPDDNQKSMNAVQDMYDVFVDHEKTISELAEVIDPHYLFWKEEVNA